MELLRRYEMSREEILRMMPQILENVGVYGGEEMSEETDLNEWIVDSLMFISFIVELENAFQIQIPDEYLQHETIASIRGLVDIIQQIKSSESSIGNLEEYEDLNEELQILKREIDELYLELKGDVSKEQSDKILVEIADKRTIIRDIECLMRDLK